MVVVVAVAVVVAAAAVVRRDLLGVLHGVGVPRDLVIIGHIVVNLVIIIIMCVLYSRALLCRIG